MNTIIMNRFVRAIILSMVFLLAISCSSKKTIGDPYILYEIHGQVLDQDGNPLKDIVVYSGDSDEDKTSANGEFVIFGRSVPARYVSLTCEDKDGDLNGGSYIKTSVSVELKLRSAGSGNNKGNYFASGVEVRMILKNDDLQDDMNPPLPS